MNSRLKNNIDRYKADPAGELAWALFKLDDKPHQSWAILLAVAHIADCPDSIRSCEIMLELNKTPANIQATYETLKAHQETLRALHSMLSDRIESREKISATERKIFNRLDSLDI